MLSKNVIAVKNLTIGFGNTEILKSIDLEIYRGEKILVSGPSGSGKSLLLGALSGSLAEAAILDGTFSYSDQNITVAINKCRSF